MNSETVLACTIIFAVIFLTLPFYAAYLSRKKLLRVEEKLRRRARRRRAQIETQQNE